jgi:hypothetical protein
MKFMQKLYGAATLVVLTVAPGLALAQSIYDPIENAVDWASVSTAVIAIFALGAVVLVAFKGGKMLLKAIRGV